MREQTLRLATAGIPPQFLPQARSHWRPPPIFELISTAPPLAPDMTDSAWRQGELRLPEAILWSQSARHCRSGRHFHFEQSHRGRHHRHICGDPTRGYRGGQRRYRFLRSVTPEADGNDIVLTVVAAPVPEPSTWMGGALAIAGLAFTQRRRLRKLIAFSR